MAKKQGKSKRQIRREQRVKRQQRQRVFTIGAVVVGALLISGLLIYPSLNRTLAPPGEIVQITPEGRPLADGNAMGEPDAPVLIEVWEDFQCPACRSYSQEIEPLIAENFVATGKVRYVFRQYPFIDDQVVTNESDQAANASMCAAEQGAFWDYHDMLFANWDGENDGAFSDKRLEVFAESLGLDMGAFTDCFRSNRYESEINQDLADGNRAGVSGTPSVFVNGQQLTPGYVPGYDEIAAAVNAALGN